MKKRTVNWLGVGIIIGAVLGGKAIYTNRTRYPDENIKIIGVIDGDTIVTENKVRIRLRHIDAPELGNCGGDEARKLLVKLVENNNVMVAENIIDTRGRPMAMITAKGKSVNKQMLQSGWVRYHSDKTNITDELVKIWADVRAQKMGILSQKCTQTENPKNPKCNIKGNIDPNNSKSRIYQMPGCVQYNTTTVDLDRGEGWFCSEEEAINSGYVRSQRCP